MTSAMVRVLVLMWCTSMRIYGVRTWMVSCSTSDIGGSTGPGQGPLRDPPPLWPLRILHGPGSPV